MALANSTGLDYEPLLQGMAQTEAAQGLGRDALVGDPGAAPDMAMIEELFKNEDALAELGKAAREGGMVQGLDGESPQASPNETSLSAVTPDIISQLLAQANPEPQPWHRGMGIAGIALANPQLAVQLMQGDQATQQNALNQLTNLVAQSSAADRTIANQQGYMDRLGRKAELDTKKEEKKAELQRWRDARQTAAKIGTPDRGKYKTVDELEMANAEQEGTLQQRADAIQAWRSLQPGEHPDQVLAMLGLSEQSLEKDPALKSAYQAAETQFESRQRGEAARAVRIEQENQQTTNLLSRFNGLDWPVVTTSLSDAQKSRDLAGTNIRALQTRLDRLTQLRSDAMVNSSLLSSKGMAAEAMPFMNDADNYGAQISSIDAAISQAETHRDEALSAIQSFRNQALGVDGEPIPQTPLPKQGLQSMILESFAAAAGDHLPMLQELNATGVPLPGGGEGKTDTLRDPAMPAGSPDARSGQLLRAFLLFRDKPQVKQAVYSAGTLLARRMVEAGMAETKEQAFTLVAQELEKMYEELERGWEPDLAGPTSGPLTYPPFTTTTPSEIGVTGFPELPKTPTE